MKFMCGNYRDELFSEQENAFGKNENNWYI